ncbi:hypothetical protein SH580_19465 [Coraliomargarita algicola]|uniref:Chromosome partition protein Smc n=1 Tax=Coraliomargarita algicola TaxID=3092156 RepID=A0ABZ0RLF0_9BACT|nr:hypothetical protein [Coraliomargarita sp. J2-16]WPJ95600.1 hypothetical protein SH580_19465 [Coraliomargarita sp. J2-16]
MQSDDDFQTTLSKWPFILGDVLLVATALAIAILGDWQLTNLQVASCVIAVALGCSLFVLPYIVEYQVRVREEAEDRSADLRIMQRHILAADEQLDALGAHFKSLEQSVEQLAQDKPDLTAPLEALESQLQPLQSQQASHANQLGALGARIDTVGDLLQALETQLAPLQQQQDTLTTQLASLTPQLDSVVQSQAAKADMEMLQALRMDVETLQAQSVVISAQLDELSKSPSDANSIVEPPVEAEMGQPEESRLKKVRSSRTRRSLEPRLLKRAIELKQDKSSQAVSRIIESKSGRPLDSVDVELEAPDSSTPDSPVVETPVDESPMSDPPQLDALATDDEPVESATAAELIPMAEAASKSEATQADDLFGEAALAESSKRKRAKRGDTVVIASVFIGIGNKPFVRGNGPGLSWETGVAMEFEEIGKWRWSPSVDLEQAIEIQIYRNDEDPDKTGKYTLEPGQALEVAPQF